MSTSYMFSLQVFGKSQKKLERGKYDDGTVKVAGEIGEGRNFDFQVELYGKPQKESFILGVGIYEAPQGHCTRPFIPK